ncbi:hypothetical protein [Poseidonibacter antarcticus]|uniref:hypothetical protein n=1 Tax=Poseidonibacter antarcticus TaxID=2478538 RepID=UPI000EF4F0C8|nr:hypothetical protein [Poseidonibacter antarcticus]
MINIYKKNTKELILASDLAGEFPLYLYISDDKKTLLYGDSIVELLDDERVIKPLKISDKGISFLLQSGVVPPPYTAYENIFIVGIGDTALIKIVDKKIEIEFSHEFPFMNENRLKKEEMTPDVDTILKLIADATIERIDPSKPTFLFHSAGKDSNTIALALAEAGYQDKVTLITHKSKGKADESEISKSIAKQLGFKHKILYEVDALEDKHKIAIDEYFTNTPFPCVDNVTLAYPLYATQIPELRGANIIDGMGNDSHMARDVSRREKFFIPVSKITSKLSFLKNYISSESVLLPLLKTPAEWCGPSGLSYYDSKEIFSKSINCFYYWDNVSKQRKNWNIYDFKNDMANPKSTEMFTRKVRNFANSINTNLVLPFTNEKVASYFAKMPEEYLFDRKLLKNKLILRDILKDKIGLDSDAIGKMVFSYDSRSIVLQNWQSITQEIFSCTLWDNEGIKKVVNRMKKSMNDKHRKGRVSASHIYRLYLIAGWHNKNRFTN